MSYHFSMGAINKKTTLFMLIIKVTIKINEKTRNIQEGEH